MQHIKALDGRQWEIVVDLNAIERVQSLLEIDLCDSGKESPVFTLIQDLPLCGKVLYAILKPEADAQNMTMLDFNRQFSKGEVLVEAAKKIWKELADFFPPERRRAFSAQVELLAKASDEAYQMADQLIDSGKIDEAFKRKVETAQQHVQSILSGEKSIESLESLPSRLEH